VSHPSHPQALGRATRPAHRQADGRVTRSMRRRRRLAGLFRLLVLLLVVAVVIWAGARVAHATDGSEHLHGVVHVVRAGDTVWSVVVAQYGSARHDVRQLVDQVEQMNGLNGRAIVPGERLRLPYIE
jgi:hypothetical protein